MNADGLREAIEALAETWDDFDHDQVACQNFSCPDCTMKNAVYDIRALLADHPATPNAGRVPSSLADRMDAIRRETGQ